MSRLYAVSVLLLSLNLVATALAKAPSRAELSAPARPQAVDYRLDSQHQLCGAVVDRQGKPIANARVAVAKRHVAAPPVKGVRTNARGEFTLPGLRPGLVTLEVNEQPYTVRLWGEDIAPPAARDRAMLVLGTVVRGQCDGSGCSTGCNACGPHHGGHFGGFFQKVLRNPWIVGTATAAAIVIPLAAANDDDAS